MTDVAFERRALRLFEAILDIDPADQMVWLAEQVGDDARLGARVTRLIHADLTDAVQTAGAFTVVEDAPPPDRVGAYRIGEVIGSGGMGTVYAATRDSGDFAHEAAVKIIKPGLLTDTLRHRFTREREMLARFSHPHIARLYDGGETADGRPYMLMERVPGVGLDHWIASEDPSLDERLRLFLQICAAVGHAHRHLIIHRDLTPSNILVDEDGQAKLIDFGIAQSDAGATAIDTSRAEPETLRMHSLTPGFAAPERRHGGGATTSGDIYSAGRVLTSMIAEPRPPELQAVIDRATAQEPDDRYATIEALADDVRNFRAGAPVAAMGEGRAYLARKFAAQHRTSLAALVTVITALSVALVLTASANRREADAQMRAQARFEQTRRIANTLLFEAFDEVSRIPGSMSTRELLASSGLDYLDALAADPSAPDDVKREAGSGYVRLAEVTGGEGVGMSGRAADGQALLGKARQLLTPLYRAHPESPEIRLPFAHMLRIQALIDYSGNAEYENARKNAAQSRQVIGDLGRRDPTAAALYLDALRDEGNAIGWLNKPREAVEVLQGAAPYFDTLHATVQRDPRVLGSYGVAQRALAEELSLAGDFEGALVAATASVEIAQRASALAPSDPARIRDVATASWYHGALLQDAGRSAEATREIDRALEKADFLYRRDPADTGSARLFAIVSSLHAMNLISRKRFQEAFKAGKQSVAIHKAILERDGNGGGATRNMAAAYNELAGIYWDGRNTAAACRYWRLAVQQLNELESAGLLSQYDREGMLKTSGAKISEKCK